MKTWALQLFVLFFGVGAFAGTDWAEVGNGGDVIICANRISANYKLYDVYESEHRYGKVPRFPAYRLPPRIDENIGHDYRYVGYAQAIAQDIIQRLARHDSEMTTKLLEWTQEFKSNARFISGDLVDVPDTGISVLPANCQLKQLVIQRTPKFPEDRLYLVAHDYWKYMDLEIQAATIVHEVIYRYALSRNPGLKSSEPVRYFNALLISNDIENLTPGQFADLRGKMGF